MRMKLGTLARTSLMACAVILSLGAAHAQDAKNYPDKTIKVVVPYPAGGATDTLGRMVANRLEGAWKQPAIVARPPVPSPTAWRARWASRCCPTTAASWPPPSPACVAS